MRPIRLLFSIAACIFALLPASAQNAQPLQCRIVDETDEPVSYAVVVAVNEQDSITSAPVFSSESGEVSLMLGDAHYTALKVQCMGYVMATVGLPLASHTIVLERDPNMLGEVVVKSGPAMIQREGKLLFNPTDLYHRTADAYSVLRLTPLLDVSDKGVAILGRAAKIHINGRDPKMDSEAVIAMLQALPPERIKKIEIEPTAGADQAASMQGGIVNVVIENPQEGYFGNASVGANYQNKRFSPTVSSFNAYASGKFRSTALLTYRNANSHVSGIQKYGLNQEQRTISEVVDKKNQSNTYNANLNFAYDFSESSVLGIAVSIAGRELRSRIEKNTTQSLSSGLSDYSFNKILLRTPWQSPGYRINASYTLNLKNGGILDVEAGYVKSAAYSHRDNYYNDVVPVVDELDISYEGVHVKPTYKQKFNKVHTLNVGYDLTRNVTDNDTRSPGRDSHFMYTEMINSLFVDWSASWSDVIFTRLGARMENTDQITHQLVGDLRSTRNYTDILPSLTVSLNLPCRGNQSLRFGVNRRLYRPNYTSLNPFKTWLTPYSYSVGNPDLKPSSSWSFDLNYSFLSAFNFNISTFIINNERSSYQYTDEEGNIVSSYANFGKETSTRFSLSYYKSVNDFWYVRAFASCNYTSLSATLRGDDLGYKNWMYGVSLLNNFTLSQKHNCFLELYYNFNSPVRTISATYHSMHWLTLDISKKFSNGISLSGTISATFDGNNTTRLDSPELSFYSKLNSIPVTASITVKYTFGNQKVKRADTRRYDTPLDSRI